MGEPLTLVEHSYSIIREDIISGELEPDSPLRIDRLKENYAVGASPLREALSRLLTDGLVTNEGLRGFRVAPVSPAELRDLTDVRKIVECAALQRSIERGDAQWEGRLVAAHYHLNRWTEEGQDPLASMMEMERLNRSFHHALIDGSNSPHLMRICMQTFDLSQRYRNISLRSGPGRTDQVNDEHDAILEATLRRDAEAAVGLLRDHIEATCISVSKIFDADPSLGGGNRERGGTGKGGKRSG